MNRNLTSVDSWPPDPLRVLIIDDEPLIRRALADYLTECGYETVTASDGANGLAQARSGAFHVVLADLRMPRVDGLKVVTTLKAENPDLPVIVVSGTGVLRDVVEAIRQGAWDYVTKPIQDMGEIAVVIERVLERARLMTERDRYQHELEQLNRSLEAEVARQIGDLQVQNRKLTALNQLSEAISAPLDLDTMLDHALAAAIVAIEADGGIVRLLDTATDQLNIKAARGLLADDLTSVQTVQLGQGIIGQIAQTGQTLTHKDFPDDPWLAFLQQKNFHTYIGVPLRAGEETAQKQAIVGTLGIITQAKRDFESHEIELLTTIGNQIGVAVARAQSATDLKQVNEQLQQLLAQIQEQAQRVQQIVDTVPEGVILLNADNQIILANPVAEDDLATLASTSVNEPLTCLGDHTLAEILTPPPQQGLWHEIAAANRRFEAIARPITTGPTPGGWVLVIRDVTQEREIERRMKQQDRLAAVGQLAAGIAHDFNNLLTVITGYSELLLHRYIDKTDPVHRDLEQIYKAGKQAAMLTRKLLAFSRQQVVQPEVLDLNSIITDTNEMLHRLISENIEQVTILDPLLGRIKADPGQIEQIIVNLVVNACDAMPLGGKLTLQTTNVDLDETTTDDHFNLKPGPYVLLTVSDTGIGMDVEVLSHIFEPFFTTKKQGKGTGLGLSMVYGIVQQNEGHIAVTSQPGRGTTFYLYLPRLLQPTESAPWSQSLTQAIPGTETILLAEDEDMVRELARYALSQNGYNVLEARHGQEALDICGQHPDPIHLLLTDVIMPGSLSGRQLAEQLAAVHPETKVLYMSGYADEAIVQHGVLDPGIAFLQKPFSPSSLSRKVREVLDS